MVTNKRSRSYSNAGKPAKRQRRFRTPARVARRRRYRGKRPRIVKMQAVPAKIMTKMHYCEKLTLASPIGSYSIYRYQSSIFDPNLTGVGHQPYYHDQWALLYGKYRVYGFKYRVQMTNMGNNPVWVSIQQAPNDSVTGSSIEYEWEKPANRGRFLLGPHNSTSARRTVKGFVNVRKLEGLSKGEFGGHEVYEANFGSSPSRVAKLQIEYEGDSVTSNVFCVVDLLYYTELFNRIEVGGS